MDFAILPFWEVSGQVFFSLGFLGRFQYRTPRFHIPSPDPDSFLAENVFFFVMLAVFSLSLFRKKLDFAILPFWEVSGQDFFPPGFLGRFQYRTPRFHSSSPDPDSFSAENVFFFVILAVFSLSLFASLRLWNSETLRLWNSETLRL